jgi:hypothetical protein
MEVTVDVYGSRQRVPNGSSHPTIINQFNDELAQLAQQSGGAGFEKPGGTSPAPTGPLLPSAASSSMRPGPAAQDGYTASCLLIGLSRDLREGGQISGTRSSGLTCVGRDKCPERLRAGADALTCSAKAPSGSG